MIRICSACKAKNRVPEERLDGTARCGKCKAALLPLDAPVAVGSAKDFVALVEQSPLPVLVDFWASWCGPCRAVAPELEKLATQRSGSLVVAKVDTDALSELAGRFQIQGIPTLVLFRDGKEASRVSGAMPAAEIARRLGV